MLACIPLFAFYLHYCVLSSMYLCDFAAGFAVAISGGIFAFFTYHWKQARHNRWRTVSLGLILLWWSIEIASAGRSFPQSPVISQFEVCDAINDKSDNALPLPDFYEAGAPPAKTTGIGNNGAGWTATTGETGSTVILFASDVEELVLDVGVASGNTRADQEFAAIRAKVGLEFLQLESMQQIEGGQRLTFAGPSWPPYRSGIQAVFLCFAPVEHFRDKYSGFTLKRVQWNDRSRISTRVLQ
jgi:hypothetical protein